MSGEIILEEKDNGAWIPRNAMPARIWMAAYPGNLSLTSECLIFKPRNTGIGNPEIKLLIKDITSVDLVEDLSDWGGHGIDCAFALTFTKNESITQPNPGTFSMGEITAKVLVFRVTDPLKWCEHLRVNEEKDSSELKNTCKRCGKIWYLGPDELEHLEGQLKKSDAFVKQMTGLNMVTAMFNPMQAAQGNTTLAATSGMMKSQVNELNEKSRCPECQSKNIDRVLVDENEKVEKAPQETNKNEGSSLADELKKLSELKEQGVLDEEEFKTAKRKLMEN